MLKIISVTCILGTLQWSAGVFASQPTSANPTATAQAPTQILDKKHPDFVRCKTFNEIGSLVRKIKACRTNAEWKKINEAGNQTARGVVEAGRPGALCTEGC